MKVRMAAPIVVALAVLPLVTARCEGRTWTSQSGKQIEAELISVDGERIRLKRSDGKVFNVSLTVLSKQDQAFLRDQAAGEKQRGPASERNAGDVGRNTQVKSPVDTVDASTSAGNDEGNERPRPVDDLARPTAEIEQVIAVGRGVTPAKALSDAFEKAVGQAVGVYVDAENRIEQDQLIHEKVVTYTDGLVTTYKVLKEGPRDGLHEVRILANVERGKLVARLKVNNVTVKPLDGAALMDGQDRPDWLIEEALKGWPEQLLVAEQMGKWPVVKETGDAATIQVSVEVRPDLKAYERSYQQLTRVLDQISTKPPKRLNWKPDGPRFNKDNGPKVDAELFYPDGTQGWLLDDSWPSADGKTYSWRFPGFVVLPRSSAAYEYSAIVMKPVGAVTTQWEGKLYTVEPHIWTRLVAVHGRPAEVLVELQDGKGQVVDSGRIGYGEGSAFPLNEMGLYLQNVVGLGRRGGLDWQLATELDAYEVRTRTPDRWSEGVLKEWPKEAPVLFTPCVAWKSSLGTHSLMSKITFKVPMTVDKNTLSTVDSVRCTVQPVGGGLFD